MRNIQFRLAIPNKRWTLELFLRKLASVGPSPGGGAAAALTGALGCGLGSKVARIVAGRAATPVVLKKKLLSAGKELDKFSARLEALIEEDARAYVAWVLAEETGKNKDRAQQRATRSPLDICKTDAQALRVLRSLLPSVGPYLGSDLKAGVAFLKASFESSQLLVEMNLQYFNSNRRKQSLKKEMTLLRKAIAHA